MYRLVHFFKGTMKHLLFSATALLALGTCSLGYAQGAYPSKPIKFVIPQAGGSANDVLARTLAESVSKVLHQPVVIENKPGANGILGLSYLVGQPADGYTWFMAGFSNLAWNPLLYKNISYKNSDLEGVAIFADTPFVSVTAPSLGVKDFKAFEALIKKNPGKYTYASAGIGNSTHLSTELVKQKTGMQMQHSPFNGAGASVSVMNGDTPFMTIPPGGIMSLIQSQKLVPLAVTGSERLASLPDVPTYKELGYDINVPGWYSVVVRKGVSKEIISKVNAAINTALKDPEMIKRLEAQSLLAVVSKPEDVMVRTERISAEWAPIISQLGIQQ